MSVVIHSSAVDDIDAVGTRDPEAAERLREVVRGLADASRADSRPLRRGLDVVVTVPGYGVVVDGVGSQTVRVLGVGPLPRLYDAARLREMASAAELSHKQPSRVDRTVPSAAARTRVVALDRGPASESFPRRGR